MGKKSEKKARDASLTYAAIILAAIGAGLCGGAVALPLWIFFPANPFLGWAPRNMGLFKLSTRFTNTMMTSADTSWKYAKNAVCGVAMARMAAVGTTAVGAATAIMADMAGINCPAACQENLVLRCSKFKAFAFLGLGIAGVVAGGSLMTLTGSLLALIGKERTKDKWDNFKLMFVGALLATIGVAAFFIFQKMMFDKFRESSWYPDQEVGVSFFLAAGGAFVSIVATVPQFMKIDKDKDKAAKTDNLAGAGAAAETSPLTAIDPNLL